MNRRQTWKVIVGVMLLTAATGCATTRAVEATPSSVRQHVQEGDEVRITTHGSAELTLKVAATTDTAIVGMAGDRRLEVAYADIQTVAVTKAAGDQRSRTILGTIGLMGLMCLLPFLILGAAAM